MALNVKAAMLVCMGFVGSMSWLLQGLAPRERPLQSPLAVRSEAELAGVYGDRPTWMSRLARTSAVETERTARRAPADDVRLASYEPETAPLPGGLPPLARSLPDPLELIVAAIREECPPDDTLNSAVVLSPHESQAPVLAELDVAALAAGAGTSAPEAPGARTYRVAKGDSLSRIARRELNSTDPRAVQLLVDLNPQLQARRGRIVVGDELTLPDATALQRLQSGLGALAARETAAPEWYTIQPKDSLASIARQHLKDGRRWREILELNRSLDPRRIVPGTKIKLPPAIRVV